MYYSMAFLLIIISENNCWRSIRSPSERRIVTADLSRDHDVIVKRKTYSNESIERIWNETMSQNCESQSANHSKQ